MDYKDSLKPNLFKILFIIVIFLVFGLPYSIQTSTATPIGLEAAKARGLPNDAAFSMEYGEYGNSHFVFRPLWSWDYSYVTARYHNYASPKFKFTFNVFYFVLASSLLYLLSCLIFSTYGTTDKNSHIAGRFYSRIGITLFAIIIILWKLSALSTVSEFVRQTSRFLFLVTLIASVAMLVFGIIGYKKQDKLASGIVILISVLLALFVFLTALARSAMGPF